MKYKIARFKVKLFNTLKLYDIFLIKILRNIADKLYLYVDDRKIKNDNDINNTNNIIDNKIINDEPPNKKEKKIDEILTLLKLFDVEVDNVIMYSEYYDIVWLYFQKLIMTSKLFIKHNKYGLNKITSTFNTSNIFDSISRNTDNDLRIIRFYREYISISLINEQLGSNFYMNNTLYEYGWYREVLLTTIMDDSEKINIIFDDTLLTNKHSNIKIIQCNNIIGNELIKNLHLDKPIHIMMSDIELMNGLITLTNMSIHWNELINKMCINIDSNINHNIDPNIYLNTNEMKNNDIIFTSKPILIKYMLQKISTKLLSINDIDNAIIEKNNDNLSIGLYLSNILSIQFGDEKELNFFKKRIKCDRIYIDEINENIHERTKFKLRFGGGVQINDISDNKNQTSKIQGKWIKCKKKMGHIINWIPNDIIYTRIINLVNVYNNECTTLYIYCQNLKNIIDYNDEFYMSCNNDCTQYNHIDLNNIEYSIEILKK